MSYPYRTKVPEDGAWVWGSEKMTAVLNSTLFLVLKVDDIGEPVKIQARTKTEHGDIQIDLVGWFSPGEAVCIPLNHILGVKATPESHDSFLDCCIFSSSSSGDMQFIKDSAI